MFVASLIVSLLVPPLPVKGPEPNFTTIRSSLAGYYSAKVVFPNFGSSSPLRAFASKSIAETARYKVFEWASAQKLGPKPAVPFEFTLFPTTTCDTGDILSVKFDQLDFTGGAHPNHGSLGLNFGIVNGKPKRLTLQDVFKPGIEPMKFLTPIILSRLKAQKASGAMDGSLKTFDQAVTKWWVLTPLSLTFLFPSGSVGAYAQGPFEAKILLADIQAQLDSEGPLTATLLKIHWMRYKMMSGIVTYREHMALSDQAAIVVELLDVSQTDPESRVVAATKFSSPKQVPIRYSFEYDSKKVVQGHEYALTGKVLLDGKVIFETNASVPVLTPGNPTDGIKLVLAKRE